MQNTARCLFCHLVPVVLGEQALADAQPVTQPDSPRKKRLKVVNSRLRTKLCRVTKKAASRKQMSKEEAVAVISQYVSGTALELIKTQIMLSGRKQQGHRYSEEFKMYALSLYHASPKCYKLLKKSLTLPGVSTLKSYLRKVDIKPGFHQNVLDGLASKVEHMSSEAKLCAIVFDEMAIKERVSYDVSTDSVYGLEDLGTSGRTRYVANHACVFMIRRLVDKWKQPVGYFFTSGTMSPDRLKSALLDCIDKVQATGLVVKVVICDQGSNNRSVVNSLGVTVDKPTFKHNDSTIFAMYDPPHLLKNIRNNLKRSGFQVMNEQVSWKYVEQFYDIDSSLPIRMAPKLTAKHINLPPFTAMRVSLATQVLSHSVAAGITTLCLTGDKLPQEAIHTAYFLERFDSLFNTFNSANLHNSHNLRRAMSATSDHVPFLKDTLKWLDAVTPEGKSKTLPCIQGWKLSINSLLGLWHDVHVSCNLKFLITNRLNQDCLENYFSLVRGRGGHRDNPDAVQFTAEHRALAVDSLFLSSREANCKEDMDSFLLKLSHVSKSVSLSDDNTVDSVVTATSKELQQVADVPSCLSLDESGILVYMAGYVGTKTVRKFGCHHCELIWRQANEEAADAGPEFTFLNNKQFDCLQMGGLFKPSGVLVGFVSALEILFRKHVTHTLHIPNIRLRYVESVQTDQDICFVVCSETECLKAVMYMIHLYFTVRIHHLLKEHSRRFETPGVKRNRKMLKLIHA